MFERGDLVEILEQYRDPGDEQFTWIVVGEEEKGRVDITPVEVPMEIKPVYTVQATWIRHIPSFPTPNTTRTGNAS